MHLGYMNQGNLPQTHVLGVHHSADLFMLYNFALWPLASTSDYITADMIQVGAQGRQLEAIVVVVVVVVVVDDKR